MKEYQRFVCLIFKCTLINCQKFSIDKFHHQGNVLKVNKWCFTSLHNFILSVIESHETQINEYIPYKIYKLCTPSL